jgi:eukaryotic-like serine/threonine-protein kinase
MTLSYSRTTLISAPATTKPGTMDGVSNYSDDGKIREDEGPSLGQTLTTSRERPLVAADRTHAPEQPATATLESQGPDRYSLRGEHARGGLGRILNAYDRQLERNVVVKELLRGGTTNEQRFVREARITARLEHPGIVPVHEAGRHRDGSPYYVMKKIAGRPLRDVIAECATLPERLTLVPRVLAVADAIAYAHSKRIIHRDLKPSNVIIGDFGETVVVDWGLAKDLSTDTDEDYANPDAYREVATDELTVAGQVLGTPAYMPPEQARGAEVDERADVYALGAILYHVLSGKQPYTARTAADLLSLAQKADLVPLRARNPAVPDDLAAITHKAMAAVPHARYPSARELAEDLRRFQAGRLVGAREYSFTQLVVRWLRQHRAFAIAASTVIALALGGGVWAFERESRLRHRAEGQQEAAERALRLAQDEYERFRRMQTYTLLSLIRAGDTFVSDSLELRAQLATAPSGAPGSASLADDQGLALDSQPLFVQENGQVMAVFPAVEDGHLTVLNVDSGRSPFLGVSPEGLSLAYDDGRTHSLPHSRPNSRVAISNDRSVIAYTGAGGGVHAWSQQTRTVTLLEASEGAPTVVSLALSPDGRVVGAARTDGTALLWNLASGESRSYGSFESAEADRRSWNTALAELAECFAVRGDQ